VAEELVQQTNSKSRFKASLEGMLGILPSYTALGMAALLPHKTLAYKESANLDVLADGHSVATLDQRHEHLKAFGGIAIKAEDLMGLGKEKGRGTGARPDRGPLVKRSAKQPSCRSAR